MAGPIYVSYINYCSLWPLTILKCQLVKFVCFFRCRKSTECMLNDQYYPFSVNCQSSHPLSTSQISPVTQQFNLYVDVLIRKVVYNKNGNQINQISSSIMAVTAPSNCRIRSCCSALTEISLMNYDICHFVNNTTFSVNLCTLSISWYCSNT